MQHREDNGRGAAGAALSIQFPASDVRQPFRDHLKVCALRVVRGGSLRMALGLLALFLFALPALAHTVSYGYVAGTQPGSYSFWFGTYHTAATANYTEGSMQLTCGGGFSATVPFTQLVYTQPAGLVKGTNYFYDAGYGGEPGSPLYSTTPTHTAGSLTGAVAAWQGVSFTNITYPGTCTFKYIPIAVPTAVWDPNGANGTLVGIGNGSFLLTEGITIAKTSPQTTYASVGTVLNYSYAVKNTGNMVLTAPLTVTDNKTTVSCPPFSPLVGTSPVVNGLATGATLTCSASYTVTQADIDVGSVTNTVSATSGTSTTPYTSPIASLTINATKSPAMTVVKSTTATGFASVGDVLSYSYGVTNTGNTTLTSAITVADNKILAVTCGVLPVGGLAPGGSIACAGSYLVTQADLDAGKVINTASSKSGSTTSPVVSVTVNGTQSPSLSVSKTTTATGYSTLSAALPYSYRVTNTGNVTLTSPISITDSKIASVSCPAMPAGGLAPNAILACSATYLVTQADLDAGSVTNTASAKSGTTVSPTVSVTVTGTKLPTLSIAKSASVANFSSVPTAVNYSFVVTNTGNVTVTSAISVSDSRIASVTCPALPAGGLAPGAAVTCAGSYAITQADINVGSVVNTASATSGTVTSTPVSHTLSAVQTRALSVIKVGTPTTFAAPGVSISYSYAVLNAGNITIPASAALSIADNKIVSVSCPVLPAGGWAPGATLTCSATYVTTQADVDAGSVTNQARASDGTVLSPAASFTVAATQAPALSVAKSSTETGFSAVGQVIHYAFLITNTGNTTVTAPVTVTDDRVASVSCPALPAGGLAPLSALTCTATYAITQVDLDAGRVINNATARSGTTVSTMPATHTLTGVPAPALTVVKTSTVSTFSTIGAVIPYSYKVTNTGNVTLTTAIAVSDNKIASVSCPALPAGGLAPNAFIICAGSYAVTQADLDAGSLVNTASTASGVVISPAVYLTITATQTPALTVIKSSTVTVFSSVGASIPYSYRVTNTGNVTLTATVAVSDNKIGSVSCPALPASGLAPTAFLTCSGTYVVTQADINAGSVTNTASVASGTTTSPTVSVTVNAIQAPALSVSKTSTIATFASSGVPIGYSYVVTNTGNVTMTSAVTIADNKISSASCPALPAGGLLPGSSITCSASYATSQADVDAGGITNTASAKSGTTTSPVVSLTVTSARSPALTVAKSTTLATYSSLPTTIPYTFAVTNTGNTTITSPVTVSDSKIASVTCPALPGGGMAPGATLICAGSYAVKQADLDAGNIVNTASVMSGTITSPTVTHTLTGTVAPKLTIAKTADKVMYTAVGDVITYSYLVSNAGNVSLTTPISVSDSRIASIGCPATLLGPGALLTCQGTYTVAQPDLDSGNIVNTASAAATTAAGPVVSASTSLTLAATQLAKLAVTKTAAPGPHNAVGQTIAYTFVVTNTGNVTITTPVSIADSKISTVTCPALPAGGLAPIATTPAAKLTCTASYTITQADVDAGAVSNSATAQSGPTSSTPPTTHTQSLVQTRALTVAKTPSQANFTTAGTVIGYSYVIKNTGNVTIPPSAIFSVADSKTTVSCPLVPAGGVLPNGTLTCTSTYTTTQADVDNGSVTNTAIATDGVATSPQVSVTVTATQGPALSVAKTSVETTYNAVGQVIHYSFAVTNSGNVTQTKPVTIADTKIASVACPALPAGGLAPSAVLTCTANYTITQSDIDAGLVSNTATAKSTTTSSPPNTHILPATQVRALSIAKSAAPVTFNKPGMVISYSYVVKNTGNTTIPVATAITVSDNRIATVNCPAVPAAGLAPNTSLTCTASVTTTQADVDAGAITNTAFATDGVAVSSPASATVNALQAPAVSVAKSAAETNFSAVGQVIHYSFVVTNSGNVTQTGALAINDSKIPTVACPALPPGGLAPAAILTCAATYTITQADLDAGTVENTASATVGTTTSTPPVVHKLPAVKLPALTVAKSTTVTTFSAAGTVIPYSYRVTNSGNVTLVSSIGIADNKIASVACPALPVGGLAPAASIVCNANYTTTQADVDASGVSNTAMASSGATTSPSVSVNVPANKAPALTVTKTSTTTGFSAVGTVIPYTYAVKNTGNVTLLLAISITDNKIPAVNCPTLGPGGLAPGATLNCGASYTITQADLDAGSVANTATAKSGTVASSPVTLTIAGTQSPSLVIVKTSQATAFSAPGQTLAYNYKVTNAGNVTLTAAVSVTDDKIASVSCPTLPASGFAPAAFITCTATYVVSQADLDAGQIVNAATGKSGATTSPTVSLSLIATQSPALTVLKTSTTTGITKAGQIVPYSYKVTNSGNITLTTAIAVTDDKIATVACAPLPGTGLVPAASITCSASYAVTQADIDAGGVTNTAMAKSGTVTSASVSLKISAVLAPALTLVKSSTTTKFAAVGETIVYNFKVTNTGNVTLTDGIGIKDALLSVDVGCPPPNPSPNGLKPGEFVTCQGAYTVTQADMDAGIITNTAFAVAGNTISPTVEVKISGVQKPDFAVAKSLAVPGAVNNGNGTFTATFAVKVTNTGNVSLKDMQLNDDYASGLPAGALVSASKVLSVDSSARGPLTSGNANYDARSSKPALLAGTGETLTPNENLTVTFAITFDPGPNRSGAAFTNNAVATTVLPDGSSSGARVSKADAAPVPFVENHALVVTKNTPKSDVKRGEIVPYTITVRNDFDPTLTNMTVTDQMPTGFKYRVGSSTVMGVRKEPIVAGAQLSWPGLTVEKGKPVTITLLLVVGGGAGEGEFTNQAWAGLAQSGILSNIAKATVRIVPDPTFDCTDIIGKVFDDANRNGYPDEGERGIANVRLSTVRGQLITTDSEGRFHVACADIPDSDRGSNFILKLDDRTLPTGYRLTTENPRVARVTRGKMAKINFGAALHRVVRLDLADAAFEPGTTNLYPQWFKGLEAVLAPLKLEPSVLRLGYRRSAKEDLELARQRVRGLQTLLIEMWKRDGSGYELSIETEVYADKSVAK